MHMENTRSELIKFLTENITESKRSFYFRDKYRTTSIRFDELHELGQKFAAYLQQNGIQKKDKVIIKAPNQYKWTAAFLGCILSGVILVPIDVKSSYGFEEMVQNKVKAKLVLYAKVNQEISGISQELKIKKIYLEDFEETLQDMEIGQDISENVFNDDIAQIVFTSGTTSTPKGVVLTHKNIAFNLKAAKPILDKWQIAFKIMINPKILSLVPLSHMYGQVIGIYIPLMIKSSVVYFNSISPSEILKAIKEEKIWILGILPKLLTIFKKHITSRFHLDNEKFKRKYERLRNKKWQLRVLLFFGLRLKLGVRFVAIISGGAALDQEVEDFFRCIAFSVFQGYGLTETAPLVTLTDPSTNKQGSIGSLLDGQEIKIIDNEVYIKGDNVSAGYYEDKEMTSKSFKDGWFKTGDIIEVDESGDVYFKGRKDDVIVREDGINVYPADIENVLKSLDHVKDSAVMGIKINNDNEVHAVLLLENQETEPKDIIKKANSKLNSYQHIDSFTVWEEDDFPRTSTFKPKKNEITKKIIVNISKSSKGEKDRDKKKDKEELYDIIKRFKNISKEDIKKGASLEKDLGLDSLDIIELSMALEEKYNVDADSLMLSRDTDVSTIDEMVKNPPKQKKKLPFFKFPYSKVFIFIRSITQILLFPFIRMLYRSRITGMENIQDLKEPVVFAANHTSLMDSMVILYSMPFRIRRRLATVMSIEHHFGHFFYKKGNIFRRAIEAVGFFSFICLILNVIPLSRTYGFKQSLENIGHQLDKGWYILIFPEGAVTGDGKTKDFEPGIGIISKDMNAPIVPIRVDGLFRILYNGILPLGHWPRIPLIKTFIGKKIRYREGSYKEIATKIKEELMSLR